jgi:hypothetical protein
MAAITNVASEIATESPGVNPKMKVASTQEPRNPGRTGVSAAIAAEGLSGFNPVAISLALRLFTVSGAGYLRPDVLQRTFPKIHLE